LARAVDCEEAQHGDIHAVNVMVGVAERLARELAGGVGRDGAEDGVRLAEGHLRIHAIDRRTAGDGDLADGARTRGLEEVHGALDIHALVERRLLQAGPHARARGEVDDLVELRGGEGFCHRRRVRQVAVDEGERKRERLEVAQVRLLERGRIEVVQIIERADGMPFAQESLADMGSDEASTAGDENVHGLEG
jgi:hypothetical protein